MHDKKNPVLKIRSNGTIAGFAPTRRIQITHERIKEYLCRLLERDAVLLHVAGGLLRVPSKQNAAQLELDVHARS